MNIRSKSICKVVLQIVVVVLLCSVAFELGKCNNQAIQNRTFLSSKGTADSTKLDYTLYYIPEDYKNVTFADTARILDSIYTDRNTISTYYAALSNNSAEIQLRLRIYELELKKTNSELPPNMRSDGTDFIKWLDFFYDTTVKYYQTINGNKDGDDADEGWNKVSAQQDVIEKVKERTEKVREDYKDAVEIYHGDFD